TEALATGTTDASATATTADASATADATATTADATATTAAGSTSTGEPTPVCSDKPAKPAGPEVQLAPAFEPFYDAFELGPVPGIPEGSRLGGCVIAFDDPNVLLVAGDSEAATGKIW